MSLYETAKEVMRTKSMRKYQKQTIDVQSANAYILVYESLSETNRKKLAEMPPGKALQVAWKLIGKVS